MSLVRRDGRVHYAGRLVPPGPWDDELDHEEFRADGLPCILHRGSLGAWCGYVGLPPGHPWHGKPYEDIKPHPDIHGGLTYGHECFEPICHVPEPGESDAFYWVGFDCAHLGDVIPCMLAFGNLSVSNSWRDFESYKTVGFVRFETQRLAAIAKAAQP